MIGDYPAHHQIQDLKQENAALHGLLEKAKAEALAGDIVRDMIRATDLLSQPQVHTFGFGVVSVGNGILNEEDGSIIVLIRNEDDIREVGAEFRVDGERRKPTGGDTLLVFHSVAGLDVLLSKLQLARTKLAEVVA